MSEPKAQMETAIVLLVILIGLIATVLVVRYASINLIKGIVLIVLGLWICSKAQ